MPRKRHTPEQIIGKLREADVGPVEHGVGIHNRVEWGVTAAFGPRRASGRFRG